MRAPERVRTDELEHQLELLGTRDLDEHDGHIARQAEAPQRRLAALVFRDHARVCAQVGSGIEDTAGEPFIGDRVGRARADAAQRLVTISTLRDDPISGAGFAAPIRQRSTVVARCRDAGKPVDRARSARLEPQRHANGGDRVEHRTRPARKRRAIAQRFSLRNAPPAADEAHPVGLVRHQCLRPVDHRRMEIPGPGILRIAGSPRRQDRAERFVELGLDEQLAEGGMRRVGRGRRQHDLAVARHRECARARRTVRDLQSAQLDVAIGGDREETQRRNRAVACRRARRSRHWQRRRISRVVNEEVRAAVVQRGIFAPSRHGEIVPLAATASHVGDHHVVAAVGEQGHIGHRERDPTPAAGACKRISKRGLVGGLRRAGRTAHSGQRGAACERKRAMASA